MQSSSWWASATRKACVLAPSLEVLAAFRAPQVTALDQVPSLVPQEQREKVASMSDLLSVVERAAESNILLAEDYLARTTVGDQ
jgi:hypothetical protein